LLEVDNFLRKQLIFEVLYIFACSLTTQANFKISLSLELIPVIGEISKLPARRAAARARLAVVYHATGRVKDA
jgi:hypothetical protein